MRRFAYFLVPAFAGLSILALLAWPDGSRATAAGQSIRLADVLPESVIAYFEIPDGAALTTAFEKHPWARMATSDAMEEFRKGIESQLDEGLDQMPPDAVKFIRTLLDALGGHVEFAVLPQGDVMLQFVGRVGVGANAEAAFAALTEKLRTEDFVTVVTEGDREVVRINASEDTFGTIDFLVANGSVAIGNDRETLLRFANGEAVQDGFAASASYRSARAEATQGNAHMTYWIDIESYLELAMSEDPDAASFIGELEMDGTYAGSVRYDEHGAHERGAWSGYSTDGVIAKLYATMKPGVSFDRRASARAGLWLGSRVDLKKASEIGLGFMKRMAAATGNENVAEMIASIDDADANPMGISVTDDIVAALGDEMSIELIPPRSGVIPDVILRASIADPEKLAATLEKMLTNLEEAGDEAPFTLRRGKAGDTAMYVLSGSGWKVRPAFAVKDGQFVAGLFAPRMRDALEAPADPLPEKGSYQAALQRLGRSDTKDVFALVFFDWYSMLSYGRNAVEPFLSSLDTIPDWLDFDALPDMDEIQEYLPPSFGISYSNGDRQVYETTGPYGSMAALPSMFGAARMLGIYAMDRAEGK